MEHDRYQRNQKLFIIGMVSLMISLTLFALTMFVLPNLLFGWVYDTPSFIMDIRQWFTDTYGYSDRGTAKLVVFILFIISIFFAYIAYFTSNSIDNEIYKTEVPEENRPKEPIIDHEAVSLSMRISLIILLIVVVSLLLDWFLSSAPVNQGIPRATNAQVVF